VQVRERVLSFKALGLSNTPIEDTSGTKEKIRKRLKISARKMGSVRHSRDLGLPRRGRNVPPPACRFNLFHSGDNPRPLARYGAT
jgi:hypothetical protein